MDLVRLAGTNGDETQEIKIKASVLDKRVFVSGTLSWAMGGSTNI